MTDTIDFNLSVKRIEEDHKAFRDVYSGKIRKKLQKFIKNGNIFKQRGKNGKINITIPRIDTPHIVFGDSDEGVGRGQGDEGDIIGKNPKKGKGKKGNKAGNEHSDGVEVAIDMEDIFKILSEDLKLPDLKPKPNELFYEKKIKYNDISLIGPESLRHNRRTMLTALKRLASTGELDKLHSVPGYADPVRLITPINSDRRYRQYKEISVPTSNAVIFFARDGSGSMDEYKCDIVSDMSWWLDAWIRRHYKRVECEYVWHDTEAKEVDQEKFYKTRYGGGTICSSALNYIDEKLTNKYPASEWNIYVFYFTDGDNYTGDNNKFNEIIKDKFGPDRVNFVGITQILSYYYKNSLKESVDQSKHKSNIRTVSIGKQDTPDLSATVSQHFYGNGGRLTDEDRNEQIKRAIQILLGGTPDNANKLISASAA